MATFKILYGRIKQGDKMFGSDGLTNDSGEQLETFIELDAKEAKLLDPDGTVLQTKAAWDKAQAISKAVKAASDKADADALLDVKKVGGK